MQTRWQLHQPDPEIVREITAQLQCNPITAGILVNRGIDSPELAARFLNPNLENIRSSYDIQDMSTAIDRITKALIQHENILIFGDYDVDGVTSTAILFEFLNGIGTRVSAYIPHRTSEGYSLKPHHITNHAVPNAIDLIITADCGSASHEAINTAKLAGIDVVVTDHHKISTHLPSAVAVVNPNRQDCAAGFGHLSGVGVVFCLLICLRKHLRDIGFWQNRAEPNLKSLCDLVALGTIADMVPLIDENRIFSRTGLELIGSGSRYGLFSLMEYSHLPINADGKAIDTHDIAFRLAPRINAAGRMDHARLAFELLTTQDPSKADRIAAILEELNTKRQAAEKEVTEAAIQQIESDQRFAEASALVLSGPDWHEGILGIAASRIANQYYRPVVLISTQNSVARGSARSIPGFDLYRGLLACEDDLIAFGGHTMAAGLSINATDIDRFKSHFEKVVRSMTSQQDFIPFISIDDLLDFDQISAGLIDELESLSPFGAGNPEPLFTTRDTQVVSARIVAKKHRQMRLRQTRSKSNRVLSAIHFNIDPDEECPDGFDQIAFRLRWNRWNGKQTPQLVIEDTK